MIRARPTPEQAKKDYAAYVRHMIQGNDDACLHIERQYGLDGYPPQVVSVGLDAAINGKDVDAAIDQFFAGSTV